MSARLVLAALLSWAALASPAAAQAPAAPADGATITGDDVVLQWTLEQGWYTRCVEWAFDPETDDDGSFYDPDDQVCGLGPLDTSYVLSDLYVAPYYWHVKVQRQVCEVIQPTPDRCVLDEQWGPTSHFDSVELPATPLPRDCSTAAVAALAQAVLLPYARTRLPAYYGGAHSSIAWAARAPLCRDLNGDGDRELIVRLSCCSRGTLSPWAIFTHDAAGDWQMAYAQVHDRVFAFSVRRRVVRAAVPAPYAGVCTRWVHYREVRWSGARFRSRLTPRVRRPRPGCPAARRARLSPSRAAR